MKTASRGTESIWRERLAAWRASGESATTFCIGREYTAGTLRWWSSRLGRDTPPPPGFVRLVPRPTAPPASTDLVVEIAAARIRVAPGFDPTRLAAVVAALRIEVR